MDTHVRAALGYYWDLYFPEYEWEEQPETDGWALVASHFRVYFQNEGTVAMSGFEEIESREVILDYGLMLQTLPDTFVGFSSKLKRHARTTLAVLGLAICSLRPYSVEVDVSIRMKVNVRIVRFTPPTSIGILNASELGQFVSVRGTATRVSNVAALVKRLAFLCVRCGEPILVQVTDGMYGTPELCDAMGCTSKRFRIQRHKAVCVDFQRVSKSKLFVCVCVCVFLIMYPDCSLYPVTASTLTTC
jgi:DNA replicative helicase MCM subunit Mcm2 (Cdc46/Mcm family)